MMILANEIECLFFTLSLTFLQFLSILLSFLLLYASLVLRIVNCGWQDNNVCCLFVKSAVVLRKNSIDGYKRDIRSRFPFSSVLKNIKGSFFSFFHIFLLFALAPIPLPISDTSFFISRFYRSLKGFWQL